jgi:hypothetical protein
MKLKDYITLIIMVFFGLLGHLANIFMQNVTITKVNFVKGTFIAIIATIAIGLFMIGSGVSQPLIFGVGVISGFSGGSLLQRMSRKLEDKVSEAADNIINTEEK